MVVVTGAGNLTNGAKVAVARGCSRLMTVLVNKPLIAS